MKVNEEEFNLCMEKDSNVAYIIDNHSGHCLEGTIKDLKTLANSKRDDDSDVLVSGIFEIMLIDVPAQLISGKPNLDPNQIVIPLVKEKASEEDVESLISEFRFFNVEQYEDALAKGVKVNPRIEGGLKKDGLSRKFSKRWPIHLSLVAKVCSKSYDHFRFS